MEDPNLKGGDNDSVLAMKSSLSTLVAIGSKGGVKGGLVLITKSSSKKNHGFLLNFNNWEHNILDLSKDNLSSVDALMMPTIGVSFDKSEDG